MPVTGLANMQDQYMLDILRMDLPSEHRVEKVWVEMTRATNHMFVAKARMTSGKNHAKRTRDYSAGANTIEEALLELAATIIVKYPVEEDERVDINMPVSKIVGTKVFSKLFGV